MTTKITVDTHAGWPVEVELFQLDERGYPNNNPAVETVQPHTIRDFYVHSHLELHAKELPFVPAPTTGG